MPDLSEVRVAVLVTDGVEEVELTEPVRALRDAGAQVEIIAPHPGHVQAMRHGEKSIQIPVDLTLENAQASEYDAVLLPGGALNADHLRMNERAQYFVSQMDAMGKPIAAICHAPWLLVSARLVRDRMLTSYYTLRDDISNAGGTWMDQELVEDANWITSRGPQDLPVFINRILERFAEAAQAREPAIAGS